MRSLVLFKVYLTSFLLNSAEEKANGPIGQKPGKQKRTGMNRRKQPLVTVSRTSFLMIVFNMGAQEMESGSDFM